MYILYQQKLVYVEYRTDIRCKYTSIAKLKKKKLPFQNKKLILQRKIKK